MVPESAKEGLARGSWEKKCGFLLIFGYFGPTFGGTFNFFSCSLFVFFSCGLLFCCLVLTPSICFFTDICTFGCEIVLKQKQN